MAEYNVATWLTAGKTAIDIIKGMRELLPRGPDRDKLEQQIGKAEEALDLSKAEVAKSLGYTLCQCTFPPQIMLWREAEKAHVCPNPACGRKIEALQPGPDLGPPSGPHSWMK